MITQIESIGWGTEELEKINSALKVIPQDHLVLNRCFCKLSYSEYLSRDGKLYPYIIGVYLRESKTVELYKGSFAGFLVLGTHMVRLPEFSLYLLIGVTVLDELEGQKEWEQLCSDEFKDVNTSINTNVYVCNKVSLRQSIGFYNNAIYFVPEKIDIETIFGVSYASYILYPDYLEQGNKKIFNFLKYHVFSGKTYLGQTIEQKINDISYTNIKV
jgi:hypothetical protein